MTELPPYGAPLSDDDYATLAEFRRELRSFLGFSEREAKRAGITAQQYQALLAIRAAPDARMAIGSFAHQLLMRPNSASGLLDRLEAAGMVARVRQTGDRRRVEIGLTDRGSALLASLAAAHREELGRLQPLLTSLMSNLHHEEVRMAEPRPIYTVGHSTRTIPEFVDLLRAGEVQLVVDVRSVPRSRTNPHYNLDALPDALAEFQIGHIRIAELGGLRKRADVPAETNGYWTNQSFHNYADYALSADFQVGLAQLTGLAAERRTAIMCAESVWWRCHRRIIADYLLCTGWPVNHLMGNDRVTPAKLTPGAIRTGGGVHYPAA